MTTKVSAAIEHLLVPMKDLRKLEGNPRIGDVPAVALSLDRFGQVKPIVWHKEGRRKVIIAGNHTWEAAKSLGWDEIAAVEFKGTKQEALALSLADNHTADLGTEDSNALLAMLDAVNDTNLRAAASYTETMLADIRELVLPTPPVPGNDDVPTPSKAISKRGDVWILPGDHRIMCGDATDAGDLAVLMDGLKADLVWTDPPYGVDYDGGQLNDRQHRTKAPIERRSKLDGDNDVALIAACMPLLAAQSDRKAPFYLWHSSREAGAFYAAVESAGLVVRAQLIWNKTGSAFPGWMAQYMNKHEPCLYAHKKGAAPHWYGPTNEVTVWDVQQARRNELHPTQKPLELAQRAIANSSKPGNLVLDPFGGSGTCLMAAVSMERRCYTMDIDPTYVDTMCLRYQLETGGKPVREGDGEPVSFES